MGAIHLRLIIEHELVGPYCLTEVFLHGNAGIDGSLQRGGEKAHGVAACRFGLIQGNIGLLQDLIRGVLAIPEDGDPDAGSAAAFAAREQVGLANGSENSLPGRLRLGRGVLGSCAQVFEDDRKLISAQSRHGIGFSKAGAKTPGGFLQQKVAGLMAEGVVQRLEVIQIDEQQCLLAAIGGAGGQGLPQPFQQQAAVGQTRQ